MKHLSQILCVVLLCVAVQSCDSVLQTSPDTAVEPDVVLTSPTGVKALRTELYTDLHSVTMSLNYFLAPSAIADGMTNSLNATRSRGYITYGSAPGQPGLGDWAFDYSEINTANILINKIPKDVLPDKVMKQIKGEAYFFRAWYYHMLVRNYGYAPGKIPNRGPGVGWHKGVVIRTKGVLKAKNADYKARSSVEAVYDLIVSDLHKSIKLLKNNSRSKRYYVTEAAAHALLARVYLYGAAGHNGWFKKADHQAALAIQKHLPTWFNPKGLQPCLMRQKVQCRVQYSTVKLILQPRGRLR